MIGSPVHHSLSPAIYNAAFAHLGLDWTYVAFEVEPGRARDALAAMRVLGIAGLSVTMPHKGDVAAAVDRLSPTAAALGAVNCVELGELIDGGGGQLIGHNTDGAGFVESLAIDEGIDVAARRCVVVGAGGAARAVVDALARAGAADIAVLNRTVSRVASAVSLAGEVGRIGNPYDIARADLVVNATSVGMGATDAVPFDVALLSHGIVVDLIYHPARTELMKRAAERGARVVGGLGMLVHQAAHQLRIWTGAEPPIAVMRAAAEAELIRRADCTK